MELLISLEYEYKNKIIKVVDVLSIDMIEYGRRNFERWNY